MRTRTPLGIAAALFLTAALAAPTSARPYDHRPAAGRIVFGAETADGIQLWTVWPNGTHVRQVTTWTETR
jgi:hypothetical protein